MLLSEPPAGKIVQKGKYATTAIEALVQDLKKAGLSENKLRARLFGGASMFEAFHSSFLQGIGTDNVNAARATLQAHNIPIVMEETGGTIGRSITIFMDDGRILLRANGKEKYIYKV